MAREGQIKVQSEKIFPIIKKWLYSDKDIFLRELVSNASDAIKSWSVSTPSARLIPGRKKAALRFK